MIYSELPNYSDSTYRTIQKKYVSVIAPGKMLVNEKLILGIVLTGMAMVLIMRALRKG